MAIEFVKPTGNFSKMVNYTGTATVVAVPLFLISAVSYTALTALGFDVSAGVKTAVRVSLGALVVGGAVSATIFGFVVAAFLSGRPILPRN